MRILIVLFACMVSFYLHAEQINDHKQSDSTSITNIESTCATPSSFRDTLITNDSIIVIHTVCAPICSSYVRVYNREWKEIGRLKAPFKSAFPEAYIEERRIHWRDNDTFDYTPQL